MASSRPQRRKKALFSYAHLISADDDSDFSPCRKRKSGRAIPRQEPDCRSGRKRATRSQERAHAKERAEVVQLERAIRESLASDSSRRKRVSHTGYDADHNGFAVADSDDDTTDFVAFQYLVDVASSADNCMTFETPATVPPNALKHTAIAYEAPGTVSPTAAEHAATGSKAAGTTPSNALICTAAEVHDNSTAKDETSHVMFCEGENVDKCGESNGYKQSQCEQNDFPALKKQPDNAGTLFQVKKARSNRTASRVRISSDGNSSCKIQATYKESVSEITVVKQGKENAAPYCNDESMNKSMETAVGCTSFMNKDVGKEVPASQNCNSSSGLATSLEASKAISSRTWCNSPGSECFHFQSQNIPHRRVIGLSRRFQPPPLHPYLARSNC